MRQLSGRPCSLLTAPPLAPSSHSCHTSCIAFLRLHSVAAMSAAPPARPQMPVRQAGPHPSQLLHLPPPAGLYRPLFVVIASAPLWLFFKGTRGLCCAFVCVPCLCGQGTHPPGAASVQAWRVVATGHPCFSSLCSFLTSLRSSGLPCQIQVCSKYINSWL